MDIVLQPAMAKKIDSYLDMGHGMIILVIDTSKAKIDGDRVIITGKDKCCAYSAEFIEKMYRSSKINCL